MTYKYALLSATAFIAIAGVHVASIAGSSPAADTPSMARFDRIPESTLRDMTDPAKSVGSPGLTWQGSVVKVAFNGGDPRVYPLIEAAASEWTANGGRLSFSFRKPDGGYRTWKETDTVAAADIRIGFFRDEARDGYWSAVGVLARRLQPSQPTMNLGDLGTTLAQYYGGANASGWKVSYARTTVLHEFGHAIGLSHEHFHNQCQTDLKLQDTVTWLMGPPNNWSREQAMFNMDVTTYFNAMKSQAGSPPVMSQNTDQASVMLYSFPDTFYKSGATSPCRPSGPAHYATALSSGDHTYFLANYPKPAP